MLGVTRRNAHAAGSRGEMRTFRNRPGSEASVVEYRRDRTSCIPRYEAAIPSLNGTERNRRPLALVSPVHAQRSPGLGEHSATAGDLELAAEQDTGLRPLVPASLGLEP